MPRSTTVRTTRIKHDIDERLRHAALVSGRSINRFIADLIEAAVGRHQGLK